MPRSRIEKLLEQQTIALARLQDTDAAAVLRITEDARREMREALDAMVADGRDLATPYTAQHLRVMLAQAERTILTLKTRLDATLTEQAKAAGEKAVTDLIDVIKVAEPLFKDAGGRVELRALVRLQQQRGLLVHEYSTRLYTSQVMANIQRELSIGLVKGETIPQVTKRITAVGEGSMASTAPRAELIARMETNRVYNEMNKGALEDAAAELDEPGRPDPMLRRMDEFIDARNSPASRAANGVIAALKEPFRVPVADVQHWEGVLKRKAGIVKQIPIVGGYYEVPGYPFHFGDRGRQVPYRATWDDGAALAKMTGAQRKGIP